MEGALKILSSKMSKMYRDQFTSYQPSRGYPRGSNDKGKSTVNTLDLLGIPP